MAKTFKTASLAGYGAYGDNADVLRGFVNQNPQLLEQIGGAKALDDYIKQNQNALFWNPETNGEFTFSQQAQDIDKLLQDYQLNSIGYAGMDDGRQKAVVKDGQTLYTGDPYSYKPAKENLETLIRGAALIGGTAGLSSLVNGGMLGSVAAQPGDFGAISGGAGGSGAGGGMVNGAFLGDGVASGIPAWDAAAGLGGGGSLLGGLADKAGGMLGPALDFVKANPKLAGAVAGGLLGGSGGSGGGGYSYNGPMPTISRQGWSPTANAQMMDTSSVVQGLPQAHGQQYAGLLRFLGG